MYASIDSSFDNRKGNMMKIYPRLKQLRLMEKGDQFITTYQMKHVGASLHRLGMKCTQEYIILTDPKKPEKSLKGSLVTITEGVTNV